MSIIVKMLCTAAIVFLMTSLVLGFDDETNPAPYVFKDVMITIFFVAFIAIPVLGIAAIWIY